VSSTRYVRLIGIPGKIKTPRIESGKEMQPSMIKSQRQPDIPLTPLRLRYAAACRWRPRITPMLFDL
jgi:hypothetical protein